MTTSPIAGQRLDALAPYAQKVQETFAALRTSGIPWSLLQTLPEVQEQLAVLAQLRDRLARDWEQNLADGTASVALQVLPLARNLAQADQDLAALKGLPSSSLPEASMSLVREAATMVNSRRAGAALSKLAGATLDEPQRVEFNRLVNRGKNYRALWPLLLGGVAAVVLLLGSGFAAGRFFTTRRPAPTVIAIGLTPTITVAPTQVTPSPKPTTAIPTVAPSSHASSTHANPYPPARAAVSRRAGLARLDVYSDLIAAAW